MCNEQVKRDGVGEEKSCSNPDNSGKRQKAFLWQNEKRIKELLEKSCWAKPSFLPVNNCPVVRELRRASEKWTENTESLFNVQLNFILGSHSYLVLDVVVGLVAACWKRPATRYKEVHVHVVVGAVANVHVVAVGVVLVVVIVVVVVVLVGVVDNIGGDSGGNNPSSEITPD